MDYKNTTPDKDFSTTPIADLHSGNDNIHAESYRKASFHPEPSWHLHKSGFQPETAKAAPLAHIFADRYANLFYKRFVLSGNICKTADWTKAFPIPAAVMHPSGWHFHKYESIDTERGLLIA